MSGVSSVNEPVKTVRPPWNRTDDAKVLVVDDTEGNRYAISRILRNAGLRVLEAATGREALRLAADCPDLIVLDINLPDMSGYDVVQRLKSDPSTATIPVLHLSASHVADTDRVHGLEAGADGYLTHPVDPAVFLATVRALLRMSMADAEARALAAAWQSTFDAISEPIMLLRSDGAILRANAAASRLLGLDVDGALQSSTLFDLLGGWSPELEQQLERGDRIRGIELRHRDRIFMVAIDPAEHSQAVHTADAVCILTDVTSRREHERERETLLVEAQEARADAERANHAKSEFLAVMSHELRTPLNAIAGYVELLKLGIRGPITEAQEKDLDRIRRSQQHLLSLINDVLNFAKIESGRLQYYIEDFPLDVALQYSSEFIEPLVRTKGVAFAITRCDPMPIVRADREKFQQIMLNLLSNAVKFTPAGGSIDVNCSSDRTLVRTVVSDTGPGVPPDKREAIFEPFVQVGRRQQRGEQGIGLGLAISRDLARGMGGDLTCSPNEGGGSRFELTVPRA
jgi:signal transduction histidine kinase